MYIIFVGNIHSEGDIMLKPEKKIIQRLERAIKAEGLHTSYKFCNWLLTSLINARDPFVKVSKDDVQRKVKVRFSEKMSEEIGAMEDHSFTSYRNSLENLGFIKVTGALKNEWSQGKNITNFIDETKRINQLDVNEDVSELKNMVKQQQSQINEQQLKLDKILAWAESDPVTPEKLELKKILTDK